jgi:hypothetical protein
MFTTTFKRAPTHAAVGAYAARFALSCVDSSFFPIPIPGALIQSSFFAR